MAALGAAISAHAGQAFGLIVFAVIGALWTGVFGNPAYDRR